MIVAVPHHYIADKLGRPIDAGTLSLGLPNQDPDLFPQQVYWDSAMTLPVAQPVALSMGYVVNGGARADIYINATNYSLRVRDAQGQQVDIIMDAANRGAGYAPSNSPAFTGIPVAPTASAFDQTGQIATDSFVWEHGMAYPGALTTLMSNTTLTITNLGGGVYVQGTGVIATLPDLLDTLAGQTVTVVAGPNGCKVLAVAGETIIDPLGNSFPAPSTPFSMGAGQCAVFASQGTAGPWNITSLNAANIGNTETSGMAGFFSNLKIATNGTGNVLAMISASSVILGNGAGATLTVSSINLTANITTTGSNGLDVGSVLPSSWYFIFAIYNPTTMTSAALLSLSATAPTMPSDYRFFARLGTVRTNAASVLVASLQAGRRAQYIVTSSFTQPSLIAGLAGNPQTPAWVAAAVSTVVPPTASAIHVQLIGGSQGGNINYQSIAAPNGQYAAEQAVQSRAPMVLSTIGSAQNFSVPDWWLLESGNVYYASNDANAALLCLGWEDNL